MSPTGSSDKENSSAERRDRGKGRMQPPGKLPTPTSDTHPGPRTAKRRRTEDADVNASMNDDDAVAGADEDANTARGDQPKSVRFYDPGQDQTERRDVKRKSRALERQFTGRLHEIMSRKELLY